MLFVDRIAVGVIEAKKDAAAENITATEGQTARYAHAQLKWRKDNTPLRFLFEATGQIIRFTDDADPAPRAREIFHFFKPETLSSWLAQPESLRRRRVEQMPVLPEQDLPAPDVLQQEIIEHLEAALASFRDVAAGLAHKG